MVMVLVVFFALSNQLLGQLQKENSSSDDYDAYNKKELAGFFGIDYLNASSGHVVRITVLRSADAPIVFEWRDRSKANEESLIWFKRPEWERASLDPEEESPLMTKPNLERAIRLSEAENRMLKKLYQNSPVKNLSKGDWAPEGMDGSVWIFESMRSENLEWRVRRNLINPLGIERVKVPLSRVVSEMQLASFAVAIWALSGIDEVPY